MLPLLVAQCTYNHFVILPHINVSNNLKGSRSLTSVQELCFLGEGEANLSRQIHEIVYLQAVGEAFMKHTPAETEGERHGMLRKLSSQKQFVHTVYAGKI